MEIWLAAQLGDEASASFNESLSIRLEGKLDIAALTGAWNDVVARHDALRSRISATGERMIATTGLMLPLPVVDLSRRSRSGSQLEGSDRVGRPLTFQSDGRPSRPCAACPSQGADARFRFHRASHRVRRLVGQRRAQ